MEIKGGGVLANDKSVSVRRRKECLLSLITVIALRALQNQESIGEVRMIDLIP